MRQVTGSVYKKPFAITGAETALGGRDGVAARDGCADVGRAVVPGDGALRHAGGKLAGLLDDSAVNIDEWIAEEVRDAFAQQEGTAFVSGNGTNKPEGFMDYAKVANGSWAWGNIGFISTGANGAFASSQSGDKLIDLIYTLKGAHRPGGTFVFNRGVQARDPQDEGRRGQLPVAALGARRRAASMLLGYPVVESEDMPALATDSYSVAFGDFRRGYLIVDRVGIRVLRDPYSLEAVRAFLHHQARRRRRAGLRRHQASEVRGVASVPSPCFGERVRARAG